MVERRTGASTYKLSLLAWRRRLPVLPGQEAGTAYGIVWSSYPMPAHGLCYIVRFNGAASVSFVAYMDDRGSVFPTDRPLAVAPQTAPALAATPGEDGFSGTVYVRDGDGHATMRPLSRYRGSFRGTMREVSDSKTWNTARSLTYRPFLASMYLRYCVFGCAARSDEPAVPAPDMAVRPLARPIDVMGPLTRMQLPDAVDAIIAGVDARGGAASGIERFVRRLLGEADAARLRPLAQRSPISLAYIEHMDAYYLNFDRTPFTTAEVEALCAVEAAINRIHRVLGSFGCPRGPVGSSPSEEACSVYDQAAFRGVTSWAKRLMDDATSANPWMEPGSVSAVPGGEWDVRTRFASACERLALIVRLEYDFRYDPSDRELRVAFTVPQPSSMPASRYDAAMGSWRLCDEAERRRLAGEYADRIALVLAAASFSSGLCVAGCVVEKRDARRGASVVLHFDRAEFMMRGLRSADDLNGTPLALGVASSRLEGAAEPGCAIRGRTSPFQAPPRDDGRALPSELRDLLLADRAGELEVMEDSADSYMARVGELRSVAVRDPARSEQGYLEIVEELEARCAAEELASDRPVITRFCEDHLGRVLLPVLEEDRSVRINRAPDALFFARYELCSLYAEAGAFDRALAEARRLLDTATTSMRAYALLVSVLARLGRFDEVVEVAKHGLRVAYSRDAIAYLLYRMAFAYWNIGDRETAAACYRLVPRGERVSSLADDELARVLAEAGRDARPSWREAACAARRAGVPVPPSPEASKQVADAAVLLADNGFHYVASKCVYHMWRVSGRDELGAVYRSLLP